jgi:hypothetical protein
MKTFLIDYRYGDGEYTVKLEAENWEDAEHRLEAIIATGHVEGELMLEIPLDGR